MSRSSKPSARKTSCSWSRLATGKQIRTFRIRGSANGASFSPDGSLLVVGSSSQPLNLRLYRVADGTQVFQEKAAHANGTTAVAFSPTDGTIFATGGRDKTTANTKIWNTSGTIVRSLDDGARVLALAFSPDGRNVASNASGKIDVWRVSDGALLRTISSVNPFAVAYSPDSRLLTTGLELFDATTGALVRKLPWPAGGDVSGVTFIKDGSAVVAGGEDFVNSIDTAVIRYFSVSDGATLVTYDNVGGMNAYVNHVAISPDGKQLAYGVATDHVTARRHRRSEERRRPRQQRLVRVSSGHPFAAARDAPSQRRSRVDTRDLRE